MRWGNTLEVFHPMLQKSYRVREVKLIGKKKKKHKRVKGYWKRYHDATSNDKAEYKICQDVCKELGNPWPPNKRGRRAKAFPWQYAAMHAYRRHRGWAYRDVERASMHMFGFFTDHSWVGKTFQRIEPLYFISAVQTLAGRIKALLVKHGKTVHIVDSTGITSDRKTVSKKGREYLAFMKLHIIICYWLELGMLVAMTCLATSNRVHDGTGMRRMLPDVNGDGDFFGDRAVCADRDLLFYCFGDKQVGFGAGEINIINMKIVTLVISDSAGKIDLFQGLLSFWIDKINQNMFFLQILKHGLHQGAPVF